MKQTYEILPVYTSDVSGVCSALFELGGLVVMHDPSGCNSTYNTHDETRWYENDSLIFISGLTERDAIMGNDEKFFCDVLDAAKAFDPAFIAVTNSPVPFLTGTDFPAITKRLEAETGTPSFYVPANGMHDYTAGASRAFEKIADRLVLPQTLRDHAAEQSKDAPGKTAKRPYLAAGVSPRINIIGLTPLDYGAAGCAGSIKMTMEKSGFDVISVWAMDESLDNIKNSGAADINLVVSSTGIKAAEKLRRRFGTPWVAGTPITGFTDVLADALLKAAKTGECLAAYTLPETFPKNLSGKNQTADKFPGNLSGKKQTAETGSDEPGIRKGNVTVIGEPVTSGSLAAAIRIERKIQARVLCTTEITEGLILGSDIKASCEEEVRAALENADIAVGDPLFKLVCGAGTGFYPLPSVAMSGRIYLKQTIDLTKVSI